MANYGLLILGAGILIVLLLFGGTIVTVATGIFTQINDGIAEFFGSFGDSLGYNTTNPTPSPSPSSSPTPSSGPTPTASPSNTIYHVTFRIGGVGTIIWTDSTSGTSGTVSKSAYPLGSATFDFRSGDKLSVKAVNSLYGFTFDHFTVSGPSGGNSNYNPFIVDAVQNDFTITAYFIYAN